MDSTYLSLEYIIMLSLFFFILVLFCIGSVSQNIQRDEKKKEPYMSRREKLKAYNKKEKRNEN
jgi:Na+/melibiose symporter-like transporter